MSRKRYTPEQLFPPSANRSLPRLADPAGHFFLPTTASMSMLIDIIPIICSNCSEPR